MFNSVCAYTVSYSKLDMISVFCIAYQMLPGNSKLDKTCLVSDCECKESVYIAFNLLKKW